MSDSKRIQKNLSTSVSTRRPHLSLTIYIKIYVPLYRSAIMQLLIGLSLCVHICWWMKRSDRWWQHTRVNKAKVLQANRRFMVLFKHTDIKESNRSLLWLVGLPTLLLLRGNILLSLGGRRPFFILNVIFSTCHNRLVTVQHLGSIIKL